MDVVADLPTDAQAAEPVRERNGLLYDPPLGSQAGAVGRAPPADDRLDALRPDLAAVAVVVVAAVGMDLLRSPAGPAAFAEDGRNGRWKIKSYVWLARLARSGL
ncbi:hypothetical protein GCM10010211_46020 [Streptomyces albospinus]|uniref:Uncharacterized protein n=1 Tax=Streptomyces albospinus TaxID=285515 RepID=A0ABQ2V8Z9_9ACTN|nr:hypothetical protein GCM10010211_46020 [Streptomyces albospinus]